MCIYCLVGKHDISHYPPSQESNGEVDGNEELGTCKANEAYQEDEVDGNDELGTSKANEAYQEDDVIVVFIDF